jgi:hypothetical protein
VAAAVDWHLDKGWTPRDRLGLAQLGHSWECESCYGTAAAALPIVGYLDMSPHSRAAMDATHAKGGDL